MQTCGHKENAIEIHPDYARSLLVIDPDHRELWISLGCALENLAVAARASGYAPEVTYPEQSDFISEYDGQPVKTSDLDQVQALPLEPGVALRFITTPTEMETILDYGLRSGVMTLPSSETSRHARVIRVPEAHEPLAIQPARHLLQERDAPGVDLDQVIVGGEDRGDFVLDGEGRIQNGDATDDTGIEIRQRSAYRLIGGPTDNLRIAKIVV